MADALTAHEEALRYGGRAGISSLHLIHSAVARPYSGYHPSISGKSAALVQSVVGNHGFIDGNKRTAWLLVEVLINRSGFVLAIPDSEPIDDLVVAVAKGEVGFDNLQDWFSGRIKRA